MSSLNKFVFKSLVKEIQKELDKAEIEKRKEAVKIFTDELKSTIKAKFPVKSTTTGNLLKGVKVDEYPHTTLVGMAAPAFHAYIVEFGTVERFWKNKGKIRKGLRTTGTMIANPYFITSFRAAQSKMSAALEEAWLK